jgi:arginase family enzyme
MIMAIRVVCFPWDLFGNAGTSEGALRLIDVVREIEDDSQLELRPIRTHSILPGLTFDERAFETIDDVTNWRAIGQEAIGEAMQAADFTLWLGGNHLSVLPVYETLTRNDLVIQLDAHLDTFDLFDTQDHLSHGNFLRFVKSAVPVVNLGHRDLIQRTQAYRAHVKLAFPAWELKNELPIAIRKCMKQAKRIWIDIDVDVIDPTFCPAVHQPSPFGLLPVQLLSLVDTVLDSNKVVGCSLSEFDPGRDGNDLSLRLLGSFVERLLLNVAERSQL